VGCQTEVKVEVEVEERLRLRLRLRLRDSNCKKVHESYRLLNVLTKKSIILDQVQEIIELTLSVSLNNYVYEKISTFCHSFLCISDTCPELSCKLYRDR